MMSTMTHISEQNSSLLRRSPVLNSFIRLKLLPVFILCHLTSTAFLAESFLGQEDFCQKGLFGRKS